MFIASGSVCTAEQVWAHTPLGERRHELRVVADEGGVDTALLQELAHELVQQPGWRVRRRAVQAVLLALRSGRVHDVTQHCAKLQRYAQRTVSRSFSPQ